MKIWWKEGLRRRKGQWHKENLADFQIWKLNIGKVFLCSYPILLSTKENEEMLEQYVIEAVQLHGQAMENLEKDGYEFLDMEVFVRKMLSREYDVEESGGENDGIPLSSIDDSFDLPLKVLIAGIKGLETNG